MQHSIDRILTALDNALEAHDVRERERYNEAVARARDLEVRRRTLRRQAAARFHELADRLAEGIPLNDDQVEFLQLLYYHHRSDNSQVRLADLEQRKSEEPTLNERPAPEWMYNLRGVLLSLRKDNPGDAAVSTSYLEQIGFGTHALTWVARLP